MTDLTKTLFEQARKLSPAERQELAELLLDTLEPDPDTEVAWSEEAHHRWNEHVANGDVTFDAFEAAADARRNLKIGG